MPSHDQRITTVVNDANTLNRNSTAVMVSVMSNHFDEIGRIGRGQQLEDVG